MRGTPGLPYTSPPLGGGRRTPRDPRPSLLVLPAPGGLGETQGCPTGSRAMSALPAWSLGHAEAGIQDPVQGQMRGGCALQPGAAAPQPPQGACSSLGTHAPGTALNRGGQGGKPVPSALVLRSLCGSACPWPQGAQRAGLRHSCPPINLCVRQTASGFLPPCLLSGLLGITSQINHPGPGARLAFGRPW